MIDRTGIGVADMARSAAFYDAALIRPTSEGNPPGYYAAFVLDPDGNNMDAVYRET